MTLRTTIKLAEKFIIDNSPTVLSGIAVTGTLTVAYLTGKASFKAAKLIREEEIARDLREKNPPFENKDKAKLVWKAYIPPALAVLGTATCIVAANHINARRMAALAAAYKLSEKQITEYKDKVIEKFGESKEREMRDELAQDQVNRTPISSQVLLNEKDTLFFEKWTGRYFRSDMETVKAAQNKINHSMVSDMYATLSDFYDWLGLPHTQESSEVGWCVEGNQMDLYFSTTMAEDGRTPCIVMEYNNRPQPIREYSYRGAIH